MQGGATFAYRRRDARLDMQRKREQCGCETRVYGVRGQLAVLRRTRRQVPGHPQLRVAAVRKLLQQPLLQRMTQETMREAEGG